MERDEEDGQETARGPRRRLGVAVALSVAVHLLFAVTLGLGWKLPIFKEAVRPGEPMLVELQEPAEPAPLGNPASRDSAPPAPARAVPPPKPSRESRAKPVPPPPRPQVAVAKPAPETPPPPKTASAPPQAPVPPSAPEGAAAAQPPEPVPRMPEPPREPPSPPQPKPEPNETVTAPTEPTLTARAPGGAGAGESKSGAPARPSVADVRAALRGGGAGTPGGRAGGRGGIEGEPIPLDSSDAKYNDYLDRLRRMIKAKWEYPCVKNHATRECEFKSAQLLVEFGILKDGKLQFVDVVHSSGFPIYDDYAVNAIKLASPFPELPPVMMTTAKASSTGVAIQARFNYVFGSALVNILR